MKPGFSTERQFKDFIVTVQECEFSWIDALLNMKVLMQYASYKK